MIYCRNTIRHNIEIMKLMASKESIEQLDDDENNALMLYCKYKIADHETIRQIKKCGIDL